MVGAIIISLLSFVVIMAAVVFLIRMYFTTYMFYYTLPKYGTEYNSRVSHHGFSISHRKLKKQIKEFNNCVNSDFWIRFSDVAIISELENTFFNGASTQTLSLTDTVIRLIVLNRLISDDYFLSMVFPNISDQEVIKADDILQMLRINIRDDVYAYNNRIEGITRLYKRQYDDFVDTLFKINPKLSGSVGLMLKELEETSKTLTI